MSLILDALKKLEQETATRKEGMNKVSDRILQPDHTKPRFKGIMLPAIAAALGGAVLTVVLITGFSGLMKPEAPVAAVPAKASPAMQPVHPIAAQPAEGSPLPVRDSQPDIRTERSHSSIEPAGEKAAAKVASLPERATDFRYNVPEGPEPAAEGALPSLKVSGIIWREEKQARRAFVNDTIVEEGSVIDGVKIEEIYTTRIRFSKGSKSFEISMEK
jgi:general secretion pathway protein B